MISNINRIINARTAYIYGSWTAFMKSYETGNSIQYANGMEQKAGTFSSTNKPKKKKIGTKSFRYEIKIWTIFHMWHLAIGHWTFALFSSVSVSFVLCAMQIPIVEKCRSWQTNLFVQPWNRMNFNKCFVYVQCPLMKIV